MDNCWDFVSGIIVGIIIGFTSFPLLFILGIWVFAKISIGREMEGY